MNLEKNEFLNNWAQTRAEWVHFSSLSSWPTANITGAIPHLLLEGAHSVNWWNQMEIGNHVSEWTDILQEAEFLRLATDIMQFTKLTELSIYNCITQDKEIDKNIQIIKELIVDKRTKGKGNKKNWKIFDILLSFHCK